MNQQPIGTENHGCFDPFALPHGGDQITDSRQKSAPLKVMAKLGADRIEVNSPQSLEQPPTALYPSLRMLTFHALSPVRQTVRRLATAAIVVASVTGCKDFTSVDASFANVTADNTFYAINGSPAGAPTAVTLFSGQVLRADQGFAYDLAFDIDAQGRAVLFPPRALSAGFSNPYSVGLQITTTPFELVTEAPKDGYRVDTALVAAKNAVVLIESHDVSTCAYAIKGNSYYSKLVITDVDVAKRRIDLTLTVNRNCGFRSFAAGIPRF